jgi:hypothetical protein
MFMKNITRAAHSGKISHAVFILNVNIIVRMPTLRRLGKVLVFRNISALLLIAGMPD